MSDSPRELAFVRHGATDPNLAGLRCGGDVDVPLTDAGRAQSRAAGQRVRALGLPIGVVVASPLARTRESAHIIGGLLGVPVLIEPGFAERLLGKWNGAPLAEHEARLAAGETPPGGEADRAFRRRISAALIALAPQLPRRPLLVGSKGVARVLGQLLGQPHGALDNGALVRYDLSNWAHRRLEFAA